MASTVIRKTTVTAGEVKVQSSQTVSNTVYFIFGLIEVLLGFRFIFKLTGAGPASAFVSFIYSLSQVFTMPFFGIFHQATAQGDVVSAVFEPATLVAMVVYLVVAWGIVQLIEIMSGRVQE